MHSASDAQLIKDDNSDVNTLPDADFYINQSYVHENELEPSEQGIWMDNSSHFVSQASKESLDYLKNCKNNVNSS